MALIWILAVSYTHLHPHVLRPFYKIWDREIWAGDHNIPVRIFAPDVKGPHPVLLFFHGGGWVTGNIDSYDKVCTNMAKITGHIVEMCIRDRGHSESAVRLPFMLPR